MNYASETSASGSATTPQTAPSKKAKSTPELKAELKKDLTEADFLKAQEANAKAAFTRTLGEIKDSAIAAVDVRNLTYHHPWMTAASAAVAGFVGAALIVPSKEETALKRLARWEKALREAEGKVETRHEATDGDGKPQVKQEKKGLFASIASEFIRSVGPGLVSALTAGMATKGAVENEVGHNGADRRAAADVP